MTTLLSVVKDVLAKNGKVLDDILWFGTEREVWGERSDVEEAFDIEYYIGSESFNFIQISSQLIIVGNGWWLEFHYSGLGDWKLTFRTSPRKPNTKRQTSDWKDLITIKLY